MLEEEKRATVRLAEEYVQQAHAVVMRKQTGRATDHAHNVLRMLHSFSQRQHSDLMRDEERAKHVLQGSLGQLRSRFDGQLKAVDRFIQEVSPNVV